MWTFFSKLQRGTFKVHPRKKRRKAKVRREQPSQVPQKQPRTWKPANNPFIYHGYSWPQVVGLTASEAKMRIERECPGVYCQVHSMGELLTMCYCSGRVRLLVDRHGRVVRTPRVG